MSRATDRRWKTIFSNTDGQSLNDGNTILNIETRSFFYKRNQQMKVNGQ